MSTYKISTFKILRLPDVENKIGRKKTGIYSMIAQGLFPAPISLGLRSVGWLESEIDQWLEDRIKHSRGLQEKNHEV